MKWLWALLLFYSVTIPVAISLAETSGFLLAPLVFLWAARRSPPQSWVPRSVALPILMFVAYVLILSLSGLQPEGSYGKVYRFLAFGVVYAIPQLIVGRADSGLRTTQVIVAYLVGVAILGLMDAVRIPMELRQGVSLFDTGNMRDPQFYMAAILLAVTAGVFSSSSVLERKGWLILPLYLAGLLFQFKRGAWIATVMCLTAISCFKKKWSIIVAMCAVTGMALLLPATRERVGQLQEVVELKTGGRYALWTEVAPSIVKDYPWGVGFKRSNYELLHHYTEHIQPGLDHLHNNVLQLQVELGWGGLLLWIWIQVSIVSLLLNTVARARRKEQPGLCNTASALLAAFIALHLNGMVEYNFGDTEILLLYTWIMGLAVAVHWQSEGGSATDALPAD